MSYQVLTPAELAAKGIKRRDVERMLRSHEREVNWHIARYISQGHQVSPAQQAKWDAACARWDHCKATLSAYGPK